MSRTPVDDAYDRAFDAAKRRAVLLRREAIDAFWAALARRAGCGGRKPTPQHHESLAAWPHPAPKNPPSPWEP